MKKNDEFEIDITGMTAEGNAVGRYDGMVVFTSGVTVGERVRVHVIKTEKKYAVAKALEVIKPSPERITVDCPTFASCGGCAYRFISYELEKKIKYDRVADALKHIGGLDIAPEPLVSDGRLFRYRNKAQLPATYTTDGHVAFGFFAGRSHRVVACEDCLLQPEEFSTISGAAAAWAEKNRVSVYNEKSGKGILRHLCMRRAETTGEISVMAVINSERLPFSDEFVSAVTGCCSDVKSVHLNINTERTNVILGKKCVKLFGKDTLTDSICGAELSLSPLSFYQVNRGMAELLYERVRMLAEPTGKTVVDLYCGIGAIGLSAARDAARLIGVEIIPQAVDNARHNAELNGVDVAEYFVGDAARAAAELSNKGLSADVVILDPPRKGCTPELLSTVTDSFRPERIVYVSCDPSTLARDAALLVQKGYSVVSVTPYDLFPRTVHVEAVALFCRKAI